MKSWAEEELKSADLGDRRRNKRLVKIVSDLAEQPNATVPQACEDWARTQAAYDFWANPHLYCRSDSR
ncbi:MAG: transposase [Oscillatoria sp. SIO1A7]|nr:transposase [Oscillatoria sp. SIO1A7]